jgi:hypothetical protein
MVSSWHVWEPCQPTLAKPLALSPSLQLTAHSGQVPSILSSSFPDEKARFMGSANCPQPPAWPWAKACPSQPQCPFCPWVSDHRTHDSASLLCTQEQLCTDAPHEQKERKLSTDQVLVQEIILIQFNPDLIYNFIT